MNGEGPNTFNAAEDEHCHELLVSGDFDLRTVPDIEYAGLHALSDPAVHTLAIDLRGVTFIDSTGIGVLVRLRVAAGERHKNLVLVAPSEPVIRLLRITALTSAFAIDGATSSGAED
jgi:anti-sigma B factor antagonist